jgi:hypothetical protein
MQLDLARTQTHNQVQFVVRVDGVAVAAFGTKESAFRHMDTLWAARPQADRVLEALYTGR